MKKLTLIAAAMLACGSLVSACASAIPVIQTVATIVSQVTAVLDAIEGRARDREDAKPLLDAIATARSALIAVQSAARAADGIASQDYASAVDALLDAYDQVRELAKPFCVLDESASARSRFGAAPPGILLVPGRAELKADLMAGGS